MTPKNLKIVAYDYDLPEWRIAKHPLEQREQCKLLRVDGDGHISEHVFADVPQLLPANSILIYNNTRVINARLHFHKPSGAAIEIFCLEPHEPVDYAQNFASRGSCQWLCFVGNSKRWREGEVVLDDPSLSFVLRATRLCRVDNASIIQFDWNWREDAESSQSELPTFATVIEAAGQIPVPPYLNRDTEASDSQDYQTVYSRIQGSVAAPTAGLHFTDKVLSDIDAQGIPRRELTLHVGAGTFQPVKEDDVAQHLMHSEFIAVPLSLIEELASTDREIVAVGTTTVRTLESLYHIGCLMYQGRWEGEVPQWYPYEDEHPRLPVEQALGIVAQWLKAHGLKTLLASTRIIIAPGYRYQLVKHLITNFHQPKSTLLLLVSAFIGDDWRQAYDYAMAHDFRFLSYGDACLFSCKSK
ncbi:MAG: S-adenosylmethionine:tRNA ribosyltransferase-isomerase [Bacteroidales bacterium]|nr:S-adenosylmethionine:tRNA ribosyltransferase-isomerase [Bacteroidales bacterium]